MDYIAFALAQRCIREGYAPAKIVNFLIKIGAAETEMSARRLVADARADMRQNSVWRMLLFLPVLGILIYIGSFVVKFGFGLIWLIFYMLIVALFGYEIGVPPWVHTLR